MEHTLLTPDLSILFGTLGIVGSLFYLHYQNRAERMKSDDRWAALKTESDNRWASLLTAFTDFKNVTVERLNALENPKKDKGA